MPEGRGGGSPGPGQDAAGAGAPPPTAAACVLVALIVGQLGVHSTMAGVRLAAALQLATFTLSVTLVRLLIPLLAHRLDELNLDPAVDRFLPRPSLCACGRI